LHCSAQGKHRLSKKRHGKQRLEKGEIRERPDDAAGAKKARPPPADDLPPCEAHVPATPLNYRSDLSEAPSFRRRSPPACAEPSAKKKRPRFDREGKVVFLRLGARRPGESPGFNSGDDGSPATALVVVAKRMGQPPVPGGSPRYVVARPLAGGEPEEWHISELEGTPERKCVFA